LAQGKFKGSQFLCRVEFLPFVFLTLVYGQLGMQMAYDEILIMPFEPLL
jgi:hypothetical protein